MRRILSILIIVTTLQSCGYKSQTEKQVDTAKSNDTIENSATKPIDQNCTYENNVSDLGIGLVMAPTTFEIFEDSLMTKKYSTINMYEDEDEINFCSMFYMPDYGIMHFVSVGETAESYKILTGFSEYKFLPKDKEYKFISWENYILDSFGVRRKTGKESEQQLKEQPTADSNDLKIPEGYELFCPMELQGDWIKVKYDCFYNLKNNPHEGQPCYTYIDKCENPLTGWIKWRNKNKLLIEIFLMP